MGVNGDKGHASMNALKPTTASHETEASDRILFGFWVYLMTDLLMFAVLFAVYAVLNGSNVGTPPDRELFRLPLALSGTLLLLTSSFTCGIGMIAARRGNISQTIRWFITTFLLGLAFLGVETVEFAELIREGHTYSANAFLSAFFILLGTHGLHIVFGLVWIAVMLVFISKRGLSASMTRKLAQLSLYWHFLDIVWIFIFTIVYLRAFI